MNNMKQKQKTYIGFTQKQLEMIACSHDCYCVLKTELRKEHCSKDYQLTCQTSKLYNKYGKEYNHLGVGSLINKQ